MNMHFLRELCMWITRNFIEYEFLPQFLLTDMMLRVIWAQEELAPDILLGFYYAWILGIYAEKGFDIYWGP